MVKTRDRQCHGADLWQIPLQLFLDVFALVRARQLSEEKVVSKPPSYYFSLQQNFSLGDLHNKMGFRNYLSLFLC